MSTRTHQLQHAALSAFVAFGLMAAANADAQNIAGAIFTTKSDGTTVNANNYDNKLDVYLNGGPQNCVSPGLPANDYYYMVTNPSGSVLLSLDSVYDRKFRVTAASGGKIAANLGNSATHINGTSPCGGITIRMGISAIDYADTPNAGGVYKAWITRVADFDAACPSGAKSCELAGFINSNTKTDNFRVRSSAPPPEDPLGDLDAFKYYDANVNGSFDVDIDTPLANWPMTIAPAAGPDSATQVTSGSGLVTWTDLPTSAAGQSFTVTEGEPTQSGWFNSEPSGGEALHGDTVTTPISQSATVFPNQTARVEFGNFCLSPSGGRTLGFWSNKNGEAQINDGPDKAGPELAMLSALNLVDAFGTAFKPTTYPQFRTWLLSASATNMAYMLSAQLAAMALNVEAGPPGFVDGKALYLPYGGTINQLMAEADALLGANGNTVAAGADRTAQERLKNFLDDLNNGADVVPAQPCAYTFN